MKKILQLILLLLFIGNMGFSQTLLLQESFEGDATNYDANTFTDDISDYFLVHSNGAPLPSGWTGTLSNIDGIYYFAAEDLDAIENPVATEGYIVLNSQTISAYDQVQVTVALATGTTTSFESAEPDGIKIQYAFDGNIATAGDANVNTGSYTTIGEFAGNMASGAPLSEDTNMDGTGDGIVLSNAFQDFTYSFSTGGATNVSIRIVVDCDGVEEVAVDNIRVSGISSAAAPTATTDAASSISTTTATLNGTVNGNSASTAVTFEYGLTTSYGTTVTADQNPVTGSTDTPVSKGISGLSPNTTYHYRVVGVNSEGTTNGSDITFTTLKLSQTITFGALPTKTYGDADFAPGATASSGLDVTYSSSNTAVATIVSGQIHIVGAGSCTIYADQAGNSTYYAASQESQSLTINKATPTITWADPADIVYGTALSATELNATSPVAGTFVYTPALTTVLDAGAGQTLSVEFTPTDAVNYNSNTATATLNVSKATPTITWADPADIVYGTALSATELNATSPVAGTFVYTPALTTVLDAGAGQTLSVEFTPTDAVNYNSNTVTATLNVSKATPTITWADPADIVYGTALSATELNATSPVAGTFVYTPALTTILDAGAGQSLSVEFTPSDEVNYNSNTVTATLNVSKATPTVNTWPTAAGITYGEDLSSATLSGDDASVTGSFAYDDHTITPNTGTYNASLTFTPTDATNNNTVAGNTDVTVAKATPVITWENPADIYYGTALSETQLNAIADIDGTFEYSPVATSILEIGSNQELTVIFTPTDADNYNQANSLVYINVLEIIDVSDISESVISMYPNPTSGIIHLEFTNNSIQNITVSDITGKQIIVKTQIQQNETIDLSGFKSGIYMIRFQTDKNVFATKIIKE